MNNYDLDNFEPAAKIVVIGVGGAGKLFPKRAVAFKEGAGTEGRRVLSL